MVMPAGQTWETRDRRRLTRCWLSHVGLVPDPAYESANVLAVRTATTSATPNLDRILAQRRSPPILDRILAERRAMLRGR
jgi:hypothetical protein